MLSLTVGTRLPLFAAGAALDLPWWSVLPFVLLLLSIALLPLVAPHWWHHNRNRAIVAALFGVPVVLYLAGVQFVTRQPTLPLLGHEVVNYLSFILLLGSLYVVAGGIVVEGDLKPTPVTNTLLLLVGAVLANLIGTTGASVLLIRPLLRINKPRRISRHIPVFFIFTVSNLGGLLTPLGDPPLFLGFLNGVPFEWTLRLWPVWLVTNLCVLLIFFVWDTLAAAREPRGHHGQAPRQPFAVRGLFNVVFLVGIMGGVLVQGPLPTPLGELVGGAIMLLMGGLSLWLTPKALRQANAFTWEPIVEVAILFSGIFAAMVPALELLGAHGEHFGLTEPWQYFWLTGGLSSFLDNAPTYLTFGTIAAGESDFLILVHNNAPGIDGQRVLEAISCGAVLMGALSYIGNGPNFMVKAIAEEAGYKMPSFFGYMLYSYCILLPLFVLVTFWFFVT